MGRRMLADRLGATRRELGLRELDVGVGTFFSNIVMYFIILASALPLHRHGVTHMGACAVSTRRHSRRRLGSQIDAGPTELMAVANHCRHHHPDDVRRRGRDVHLLEQFSLSESQVRTSGERAAILVCGGKENYGLRICIRDRHDGCTPCAHCWPLSAKELA